MFALITTLLFFAKEGGFTRFYNQWLNIPGFEAWKFINLGIFIAAMVYLLKTPLTSAFKARRDEIRAELIKAEKEKQAALAQMATADAKLADLEKERGGIIAKAEAEAAAEKERILLQTETDVARLKQQTDAELARLISQTRADLRRFSAEQSITLAEAKLRSQIDGRIDAGLVKAGIQEIGGLN